MRVHRRTLKLLAAAIWYVGGGILAYKGTGYLVSAAATAPVWPPLVSGAAGLILGLMRGRTMFLRANRRNLQRIDALPDPRIWQVFRPGFFAALVVMIAFGAFLAWLARQGYWGRVVVGGAELTVATALLTSSVAFWASDHGVGARAGAPDSD